MGRLYLEAHRHAVRKPKLPRGGEPAASTNVQLQVRVLQTQLMHEQNR